MAEKREQACRAGDVPATDAPDQTIGTSSSPIEFECKRYHQYEQTGLIGWEELSRLIRVY